MRAWILAGVVLGAGTLWAAVAFPHAMLSPGNLSEGHRELEGDCFACHVPFRGPDPKCLACHDLAQVDAAAGERPAFHAALESPRCAACHTDHAGREAGRSLRRFRHDLLRAELRARCAACHAPPAGALHSGMEGACGGCHGVEAWTPADFDHAALFRFDTDHPPDCASCHPGGYQAFTCYGCHEHTPGKIAGEHREEGIRDFEDCASCHRSGDEDEAKRAWRRGRRSSRGDDGGEEDGDDGEEDDDDDGEDDD